MDTGYARSGLVPMQPNDVVCRSAPGRLPGWPAGCPSSGTGSSGPGSWHITISGSPQSPSPSPPSAPYRSMCGNTCDRRRARRRGRAELGASPSACQPHVRAVGSAGHSCAAREALERTCAGCWGRKRGHPFAHCHDNGNAEEACMRKLSTQHGPPTARLSPTAGTAAPPDAPPACALAPSAALPASPHSGPGAGRAQRAVARPGSRPDSCRSCAKCAAAAPPCGKQMALGALNSGCSYSVLVTTMLQQKETSGQSSARKASMRWTFSEQANR